MATTYVCTQCGNINTPKLGAKGNGLIEIILWLFFLVPGLIYSIWRRSGQKNVCSKCKSDQVIPVDAPRAKKILEEIGVSQEPYLEEIKKGEVEKKRLADRESKIMWWILIAFIIVPILFAVLSALA